MEFYDGNRLLTTMDINGKKPEIFIAVTNRSAGKTTYFYKKLIKNWIEKKWQFSVVFDTINELNSCADSIFSDVCNIFFPNSEYFGKMKDGKYSELWFNGELCGFGIALSTHNYIKKRSHIFNHVMQMVKDEFQHEDDKYMKNEVQKMISIHQSIARGNGCQSRYVPLYLIGNPISMLNPYYTAFNITPRLVNNARIIRGDGWVLEQSINESAKNAQNNSVFNRALNVIQNNELIYVNDNNTLLSTPNDITKYFATIKFDNDFFSIVLENSTGIFYVLNKYDATYPVKIAVSTNDIDTDFYSLDKNEYLISHFRKYFKIGNFRFENLKCKLALFNLLSIR